MKRREFFKKLGVTIGAVVLAPKLLISKEKVSSAVGSHNGVDYVIVTEKVTREQMNILYPEQKKAFKPIGFKCETIILPKYQGSNSWDIDK